MKKTICKSESCNNNFLQYRPTHIYCSKRCSEREKAKRLRKKRESQNLCGHCGDVNDRPNMKTCTNCSNRYRDIYKRNKKRKEKLKSKVDYTMKGKRYGYLIAIESKIKNDGIYWKCQCECGNVIDVLSSYLTNGDTKSCGCYKKEQELVNLREKYEEKRVDGVAMQLFSDKARSTSSTGYRGVFKYKTRVSQEDRYGAHITVNKNKYYKRGFLTAEDAYYKGRLLLEKKHLPQKEE